ncbi:hypothetical protein A6F68_01338 [Tsuneonella dongtanensis]|uniref:YdhG-like domain-containing protein n=1 Tax=Tsuneonella dongtanensis TaxID=692370 RepID=A0A1B2ACS7_9SPHN|nr:DUF1801 domain-containing protein [Tsuneonella dongtanensis]ANY19855.1 hypothetical protein A6F68_01338 [Tsuneonella dongtanensis]
MAGTDLKTTTTGADVAAFLDAVPDPRRRDEGYEIEALHRRVTGLAPRMWGPSIVGYGSYDYTYESGQSGTWCRGGFSPRKAALTVYLMGSFDDIDAGAKADALFDRLGPHSTGKSCLYIKRLEKVDAGVLEELVTLSWQAMNARWPA